MASGWPAGRRVLNTTTSGSACVNDTVFQYLNSHLPFGGVGNSGVGAYHGRASFDEFSQQYRLEEELDTQEIRYCLDIVDNERTKWNIQKDMCV